MYLFHVRPRAFEYTVGTRTRGALHKAEQTLHGIGLQGKKEDKYEQPYKRIRQRPKIKSVSKKCQEKKSPHM